MNNKVRIFTTALLVAGSSLAMNLAHAQLAGTSRVDVLQHDLHEHGQEVVQARVAIDVGVKSINHSHPGAEIAYVLEGTLEYTIEGKPPVTLKPGEAVFIPAGANHIAKNVGNVKAVELATYLVAKGKPLLVPAN
ncbi:cupin domain-containing protein [Variovorax paradoxus]|nr:cupin domain-containing protein [Variovorax paradoxus]